MWGLLLALGIVGGVVAIAHKAGAATSGQLTDDKLTQLKVIKDIVLRTAAGNPQYAVSAAERQQAVDFARANGLPKTGLAILIQSSTFPMDETWPGTNMSVGAYLTSQLATNPFLA